MTHTDALTITFSAYRYQGAPGAVEARIYTDTPEEAKAVAALFPKSYGLKATFSDSYRDGERARIGLVQWRADLSANATNGGRNETGIARYRKTVAKAEALGIEVSWEKRYSTSYETAADLDADLA